MNHNHGKLLNIDGGIVHFEHGQLLIETGAFYPLHNGAIKRGHIRIERGYRIFIDLNGVYGIGVMKDKPKGVVLEDRFSSIAQATVYIYENLLNEPIPMEYTNKCLNTVVGNVFAVIDPETLQYRLNFNTGADTSFYFKEFNKNDYPTEFEALDDAIYDNHSLYIALNYFFDDTYWVRADIDIADYDKNEQRNFLESYYSNESEIVHFLCRNDFDTNSIIAECIFETNIIDYI